MHGIRKVRKFCIADDGNEDYETLINSPLVEVVEEKPFNHFANYYIVVTFIDMGFYDDEDEAEEEKGTEDEDLEQTDNGGP